MTKRNKNNAETLLKTDRAIYYHVRKSMLKQGTKSVDSYEHEDEDGNISDIEYGTECLYFGTAPGLETSDVRCALGFIMNRGLAYDNSVENNDASDDSVLATVIESNPEWDFTVKSAKMLLLLQHIHDNHEADTWERMFLAYDGYFSEDGSFTGFEDQEIDEEKEQDPHWLLENITKNTEIHVPGATILLENYNACHVRTLISEQSKLIANEIENSMYPIVTVSEPVVQTQQPEKELV